VGVGVIVARRHYLFDDWNERVFAAKKEPHLPRLDQFVRRFLIDGDIELALGN
jgi:hypothetical protein